MKPTMHEYRGYVFTISYQAADPIFSVRLRPIFRRDLHHQRRVDSRAFGQLPA